jgi:type IV pilus assembly protein PilW
MRPAPRPAIHPAVRGFSLLEMLTAVAVASFILLAVTSGFLQFGRLFRAQEGMRSMQSSAQRALALVEGELAMAGYGLEPYHAFGFVADDGTALGAADWKGLGEAQSDRLRFYARDRLFMATVSGGAVSASRLTVDALLQGLEEGEALQVFCPGADRWAYARVAEAAPASAEPVELSLAADAGRFPDLASGLDAPCFDTGSAARPVRVFRVLQYDLAVRSFGGRPHLMLNRTGGWDAFDARAEPWVEDVAALRVTFLRADGTPFLPDPSAPPGTLSGAPSPAFGDEEWDAEPFAGSNHPLNVRAVRVSVIARAALADQDLRSAGLEGVLPAAEGVPALTLPQDVGHRHVLLTSSVVPRNLTSGFMFIPPYTSDAIPPVGTPGPCRTEAPSDGLVCWGG